MRLFKLLAGAVMLLSLGVNVERAHAGCLFEGIYPSLPEAAPNATIGLIGMVACNDTGFEPTYAITLLFVQNGATTEIGRFNSQDYFSTTISIPDTAKGGPAVIVAEARYENKIISRFEAKFTVTAK